MLIMVRIPSALVGGPLLLLRVLLLLLRLLMAPVLRSRRVVLEDKSMILLHLSGLVQMSVLLGHSLGPRVSTLIALVILMSWVASLLVIILPASPIVIPAVVVLRLPLVVVVVVGLIFILVLTSFSVLVAASLVVTIILVLRGLLLRMVATVIGRGGIIDRFVPQNAPGLVLVVVSELGIVLLVIVVLQLDAVVKASNTFYIELGVTSFPIGCCDLCLWSWIALFLMARLLKIDFQDSWCNLRLRSNVTILRDEVIHVPSRVINLYL